MTKKQLNKILSMYKSGISTTLCIACIIELSESSGDASVSIVEFLHEVDLCLHSLSESIFEEKLKC